MRFFEKDLRVKITVILLALVLFSLLAAAIISHALVTRIVRDSIERSALDSARLTGNIVESSLERRVALVELLSNYPVLRDPAAATAGKVQVLSLFVAGYPLGKGAMITDTVGGVVAGTGELAGMGSAGTTAWFENAESAVTSLTFVNKAEALAQMGFDEDVLAVSTPVRDSNNQLFAFLTLFTSLDDINRSVKAVKVESSGHGFLITYTGTLVSGYLFTRSPKRPSAGDTQSVDRLVEGMAGGASGSATVKYDGASYLVSYAPLGAGGAKHPELDWVVGVVVPAGEAFAPANEVALALFGLAALVLIIASVAAFFFGRSIARPLDELVKTAREVGSGDLTGEVVIRTRDQIGSLAAAFLRMRDYLRGALAEAGYTSSKMSLLAEEQSAATADMFANTDEIVESVVVLARNMEVQTEKMRKLMEFTRMMSEKAPASPLYGEALQLIQEAEILAEVGANKAVEIASATQDQRAASRDIAAAARRLTEMARELKGTVENFKV